MKGFIKNDKKVPENRVNIIEPFPTEMDYKEFMIFISTESDPISKSALLSTTIQTNMLLSRMLDPTDNKSNGFFGKEIILFYR